VNAILLGLDAPSEFSGRKYNITNDEPVDLYETVDHIFQKLGLRYRRKNISFRKAYAVASALEAAHRTVLRGKEPLLTRYSVCAMGRSRTLNIEAAKRDLGYRPQTALSDAISHVIESLH
jgi:nucleoside-diphosphate-sugar epimerase